LGFSGNKLQSLKRANTSWHRKHHSKVMSSRCARDACFRGQLRAFKIFKAALCSMIVVSALSSGLQDGKFILLAQKSRGPLSQYGICQYTDSVLARVPCTCDAHLVSLVATFTKRKHIETSCKAFRNSSWQRSQPR
jgi:hypothetical protein